MITRLSLKNFQSLHNVDLELGPLTVIVGPSSSGKTAVVRALRALATNARGSGVITHGTDKAAVTVSGSDRRGPWEVTWHRTSASGSYTVREPEEVQPTAWGTAKLGEPGEYTKLGGSIPPVVSLLLGIGEGPKTLGPELCIAGQFDRPYLLDETGSKVAGVLGSLTQVNVLFDAAREANRRKGNHSTALKTRETDLAVIIQKLQDFKNLKSQIENLDAAEAHLVIVVEAKTKATRLRAVVNAYENAATLAAAVPPEIRVPDLEGAETARTRLFIFKDFIGQISAAKKNVVQYEEAATALREEVAVLDKKLHDLLVKTGTCPMCGQDTKEL